VNHRRRPCRRTAHGMAVERAPVPASATSVKSPWLLIPPARSPGPRAPRVSKLSAATRVVKILLTAILRRAGIKPRMLPLDTCSRHLSSKEARSAMNTSRCISSDLRSSQDNGYCQAEADASGGGGGGKLQQKSTAVCPTVCPTNNKPVLCSDNSAYSDCEWVGTVPACTDSACPVGFVSVCEPLGLTFASLRR
jgi:hypothetical protein